MISRLRGRIEYVADDHIIVDIRPMRMAVTHIVLNPNRE